VGDGAGLSKTHIKKE